MGKKFLKNKKIIIFCDGGLGNRFGSLIGGLHTAKLLNIPGVICWPANNWCYCNFEDLFDIESLNNISVIDTQLKDLFLDKNNFVYLSHDQNIPGVNPETVFQHGLDSVKKVSELSQTIVYTHNSLPHYVSEGDLNNILSSLKIKKEILDTVYSFCEDNQIDKNTIGIHFRKTDHSRQLDEEPIFEEIKKTPFKKYFVCSDTKETEEKFSSINNVAVFPKTSYVEKLVDGNWRQKIIDSEGRPSHYNVNRPKQSIIEAFVDMLILSRTSLPIRSMKSSFFLFAERFSRIEKL